ncbi:MAG: N-acetylneuraminate synthase family protein, partial [Albidovulum sp.]|nr:N-acetylneuraminate synthase family protein [Albidovulum sp.]
LECTNLYPSPPDIVSLQGIDELRQAFPNAEIGFSDHSVGPVVALASVALGATIVERHFTDSRYRLGPDISCSMDPAELKYLIDRSREVHMALHNRKRRTAPEEDVYLFARGSIVADRDLPAGHVISETDIWARRPGTGEIPGFEFDSVLGRKMKVAKMRNSQLSWSDFE